MRILVRELRYERLSTPFIGSLHPYAHQLKTLEYVRDAIRKSQTICIENTSVTGSGKTLANFASSLLDGTYTCGVYPTNELILDQYVALQGKFSVRELAILDSQGMNDIIEEETHMRSHAHALAWATEGRHTAVLTNPDVLYLAMYNLYGQMFNSFSMSFGVRAFRHILGNYPVIAFDEFHLYTAKQIANAAFMIGTAKSLAPTKPHAFIFSSATPQPLFKQYVQRLGIDVLEVTDRFTDTGHVVCEPIEVNILPADLLHWQGGDAIRATLETILSWADSCSPTPACGVFIVDSVYEAKSIAEELRKRYVVQDVGEVHGYMDPDERSEALQRRLSVGTTTIDVGIDLTDKKSKEFLVCEARSAAQAIQRIGRLGRRGREPHEIQIPNRIWLVVPEYVYQYMQRIGNDVTTTREIFNKVLNDAYLEHEKFLAYTRKYSPLEAVAACERVKLQPFDDDKAQTVERFYWLVPTLYDKEPPVDQQQAEERYKKYRKSQVAVWSKFGTEIRNSFGTKKRYYLPDLESFRGGMESDFTVALYDELDKKLNIKPVKTYNLPFVLRRTQGEELSKQSFEELVRRNHPDQADQWLASLHRQKLLGYIHVQDLVRGKAKDAYFEIDKDRIHYQFQQVIRLEGIRIDGSSVRLRTGKESINSELKKRQLNCWVSEQKSFLLSKALCLPPLFAVYPLHALHPGGKFSEWSIAFGLDAFLLECNAKGIRRAHTRSDNSAIIL
jgi:CRISPR-associated helicase Cas3